MPEQIFAYGTLRVGQGNFVGYTPWILAAHEVETLTIPGRLVSLGAYPAVLWDPQSAPHPLVGNVLEVTLMAPFDYLEGYPVLYDRVSVETRHGPAWLYIMHRRPSWHEEDGPADIPSGDWLHYIDSTH